MVFKKYTVCKTKTRLIIEKLQTYSNDTHSFEELKIENLQNQYKKPEENLKMTSANVSVSGENR